MTLPTELDQVPEAVAQLLRGTVPTTWDVYGYLFQLDSVGSPSVFVDVESFATGRVGCNLAVSLGVWCVTPYTEPANATPELLRMAQQVHDDLRELVPSARVSGDGRAIYGEASPAWRVTVEVET